MTMPRRLSRSARSCRIGPIEVFRWAEGLFHHLQDVFQVRRIAAGANKPADFAVEGHQPDAVLLMQHQIGQRRGRPAGVVQFRHRCRTALILHALARVQEQVAHQVRLFLELFQVVFIGASEHLPIEIAEIVAGRVLAVFGELDREPVERTAMSTRGIALDDPPRAQRQPLQTERAFENRGVVGWFACLTIAGS